MNINCTYDCLYQIDGKCCLTTVPKSFTSAYNSGWTSTKLSSYSTSYYDGDCPYRTLSTCGTFRSAMVALS